MKKCMLLVSIHILIPTLLFAQELDSIGFKRNPLLDKRFIINTGVFVTSKSVDIQLNGDLPSNPIDFGKTLGLRRQDNTFAANFNWRFSKRKHWYAAFEYFNVNNTQSAILEDELKWQNTIYPIGIVLDSGFKIDMYRIFFGRVISRGDKHELSVGMGIHTLNINTFVQASAFVGDRFIVYDPGRKRAKVLAPVPNIGLRYLYAPHHRWSFNLRAEYFSLTVGEYSGTLWNLAPTVSFQITDYLGVGASYKYFKADLNIDRPRWDGGTNLLYQGPIVSVSGMF